MTPSKPTRDKYDPRKLRASFGPKCVFCLRGNDDGVTLYEPGSSNPWCAPDSRAIAFASKPEALPNEPDDIRARAAKLLASGWKPGAPIAPGFFRR